MNPNCKILSGKEVADSIEHDLILKISELKKKGIIPKLYVFLIGENSASATYVAAKEKASARLGIQSETIKLPAKTSEEELLNRIHTANLSPDIHGILVQLPLPKHINENRILGSIDPFKDVDCFHPINVGKLSIGTGTILPCTPAGVIEILKYYQIKTEGKHVTIIGRSNIVGKPMAQLLIQNNERGNATVTICHSKTRNLSTICQLADIVIVAIGQANFLKKEMIKDGAIVIDVGINRYQNDDKQHKICGDADFNDLCNKASAITPVPGGVGKLTIAMLMKNTVLCAEYLGNRFLN